MRIKILLNGISGWLHIALFPLLISFLVSIVVYINMPDANGILVSAFLCICGMITGLIMATRIVKKRGMAAFQPKVEEDKEEDQETIKPV